MSPDEYDVTSCAISLTPSGETGVGNSTDIDWSSPIAISSGGGGGKSVSGLGYISELQCDKICIQYAKSKSQETCYKFFCFFLLFFKSAEIFIYLQTIFENMASHFNRLISREDDNDWQVLPGYKILPAHMQYKKYECCAGM